jgi:CheY-like chemotaxis protein
MMDEDNGLPEEIASGLYNASDQPFDFMEEGQETALICEADASIRKRIIDSLEGEDYYITEAASVSDALKYMRFHVYQLIVVNENFETEIPDDNLVLEYLNHLPMTTRRNIFVAMVSSRFRSMNNMAAFNQSVNLIIDIKNVDKAGPILKYGIADNEAFYHVFNETLKKTGRV